MVFISALPTIILVLALELRQLAQLLTLVENCPVKHRYFEATAILNIHAIRLVRHASLR